VFPLACIVAAVYIVYIFVKRKQTLSKRVLLRPGDTAPDFALPDADGRTHRLTDYRGKYVVLAFYPSDNTPGCSLEMKRIADGVPALSELNAVPIGISVQDVASHRSFCDRVGIPFPLLADTERKMSHAYGVVSTGRSKADRVTYIVDPQGVIVYVDPDVDMNLFNIPGAWIAWLRTHAPGA
jgi:peroxiredoxin Q/BCP